MAVAKQYVLPIPDNGFEYVLEQDAFSNGEFSVDGFFVVYNINIEYILAFQHDGRGREDDHGEKKQY